MQHCRTTSSCFQIQEGESEAQLEARDPDPCPAEEAWDLRNLRIDCSILCSADRTIRM